MMPIKFTLWSAYAENEGKRLVEAQATIPEIHCTRVSVGYFNCKYTISIIYFFTRLSPTL